MNSMNASELGFLTCVFFLANIWFYSIPVIIYLKYKDSQNIPEKRIVPMELHLNFLYS